MFGGEHRTLHEISVAEAVEILGITALTFEVVTLKKEIILMTSALGDLTAAVNANADAEDRLGADFTALQEKLDQATGLSDADKAELAADIDKLKARTVAILAVDPPVANPNGPTTPGAVVPPTIVTPAPAVDVTTNGGTVDTGDTGPSTAQSEAAVNRVNNGSALTPPADPQADTDNAQVNADAAANEGDGDNGDLSNHTF